MTGIIICGVFAVAGYALTIVGAINVMRRLEYERDRAEADLEAAWAEIRRLRLSDPAYYTNAGVFIESHAPKATADRMARLMARRTSYQ